MQAEQFQSRFEGIAADKPEAGDCIESLPLHVMTPHAELRAQQRAISREAISFTIQHGKRSRHRGAIFYYLGKRFTPKEFQKDARVRRWEGTTIIVSNDESTIITVYRNRTGMARV